MVRPTYCQVLAMRVIDILEPNQFNVYVMVRIQHSFYLMVALLLLAGINCENLSEFDNQQISEALNPDRLQSSESWGFELQLIDEGRNVLDLMGDYAVFTENNEESFTEISGPITIHLFDQLTGELSSTITCDSALYKSSVGVFEMYGSVEIITVEEKILRSEYLKWQRKQDRVSTPEFVTFISPPDSIAAMGFEGNSDLSEYTLNEGGGKVVID